VERGQRRELSARRRAWGRSWPSSSVGRRASGRLHARTRPVGEVRESARDEGVGRSDVPLVLGAPFCCVLGGTGVLRLKAGGVLSAVIGVQVGLEPVIQTASSHLLPLTRSHRCHGG
jgi:hypothetical protein